jgi:tryptophan-rich sensory protein
MLYAMMGVAAGLVWARIEERGGKKALVFFAIQLALNALWSYLFLDFTIPYTNEIIVLLPYLKPIHGVQTPNCWFLTITLPCLVKFYSRFKTEVFGVVE